MLKLNDEETHYAIGVVVPPTHTEPLPRYVEAQVRAVFPTSTEREPYQHFHYSYVIGGVFDGLVTGKNNKHLDPIGRNLCSIAEYTTHSFDGFLLPFIGLHSAMWLSNLILAGNYKNHSIVMLDVIERHLLCSSKT